MPPLPPPLKVTPLMLLIQLSAFVPARSIIDINVFNLGPYGVNIYIVLCLFNDTVTISHYIETNDRTISE
jgi:hypothetical protein